MDIIVGRTYDEIERFGKEGTIFLGKEYVKMENFLSLSNNIYLDVNYPHLILICGKRGQGKSYTLAAIAEGLVSLPKELSDNISVVIFDTMGIFWTMKFPNYRDAELLEEWGLKPRGLKEVQIFIPKGFVDLYSDLGIPFDKVFTINPTDLSEIDWIYLFGIKRNSLISFYIQKIIRELKEKRENFAIDDILRYIESKNIDPKLKFIILNYFDNASRWGLFHNKSTLGDIFEGGKVSIIDLSMFTTAIGGWSIKNLVIGLLSKKIFYERLIFRKKEEIEEAQLAYELRREKPLVWIMIDEAHEVFGENSPAHEPLIQIIREGRQPGISLVLATQQPGKLPLDVITQTDILISHRVTAQRDLEALNEIMRNFSARSIEVMMNDNIPKRKGAALILDDRSERIYPVQIRPRVSWHGGSDPALIRKRW